MAIAGTHSARTDMEYPQANQAPSTRFPEPPKNLHSHSDVIAASDFTVFAGLPIELKFSIIAKTYGAPKLISITQIDFHRPGHRPGLSAMCLNSSLRKAPAALHVCRGTRQTALKSYTWVALCGWVNMQADIFYFDSRSMRNFIRCFLPPDTLSFFNQIQNVAFHHRWLSWALTNYFPCPLDGLRLYSLKNLYVVFDGVTKAHPLLYTSEAKHSLARCKERGSFRDRKVYDKFLCLRKNVMEVKKQHEVMKDRYKVDRIAIEYGGGLFAPIWIDLFDATNVLYADIFWLSRD